MLFHLLKKTIFFGKPVFRLPDRLGLQGEFRQDHQNVEPPQSGKNHITERFVELHPFTVVVNSGVKKKIASRLLCAEHDHLYLVIIAVSVLQFYATVINGKTVTLLDGNSITHGKVPVAVRVLELHEPLRW